VSVRRNIVRDSSFLALTFSEPMNATRADRLANYRLVWAPGAEGESAIPIRNARYDAASQTVTLRPIRRLPLTGTVILTVVGTPPWGLKDTAGNFLDSAGPGQPGSDYTAIINL
jgi:hypothetical protein